MTSGSGKRCAATSKRTGERCKNPAMAGGEFCFLHTERRVPKRGAPKGNKNNLKHGVNSQTVKEYLRRIAGGGELESGFLAFDILKGAEDRKSFIEMIGSMCRDIKPKIPSEFYEIELLALCLVLLRRAMKDENTRAMESIDRLIRLHASDPKSGSNHAGVSDKVKPPQRGTTPAEWAAAFLARMKEKEKQSQRSATEEGKTEE